MVKKLIFRKLDNWRLTGLSGQNAGWKKELRMKPVILSFIFGLILGYCISCEINREFDHNPSTANIIYHLKHPITATGWGKESDVNE